MVVNSGRRDDLAVVRDTPRPAHRNPVRLAQPVRLETLLGRHRIVPVKYTIVVQQ